MKAADLFAGCGGLSKGFEQAGIEISLAIEQWSTAREVYADNFSHPIFDIDLHKITDATRLIKSYKPDIIIGGPPCQEFSVAGGRKEGRKAELTIKFAKIIAKVKPKWFVLENVQGILKSKTWSGAKEILSNAGYGLTEVVLDAAYYGVPQHRKRFFAIGKIGEVDSFLQSTLLEGKSKKPMSIREFLGNEIDLEFYYRHPRNWGRKAIFSIDEPSPTIRSTNRPVAPGYKAHENDAGCSTKARALSFDERAKIQTFGTDFVFKGSKTDREMMIANAVPVKLAEFVATTIKNYELERTIVDERNFKAWLSDKYSYNNRSQGNVISRLNRAAKIIEKTCFTENPLDAIHALERRNEYQTLTPSVKSQIKKAVKLRSEFSRINSSTY